MSTNITAIQPFKRPDTWQALKKFTNARIALGRTGNAILLAENLQFRADHAQARDAVYTALDTGRLAEELKVFHLPVLQLHSRAKDRGEYLQRPDKGRLLDITSAKKIQPGKNFDIAFTIADGLSAKAVQLYTQPVLQLLMNLCNNMGYAIAPLCIAEQARVAIGDEIGMLSGASVSVVFVGERPGLSSPHSMGIYITYSPVTGLTDESRYCISNIHVPGGLAPADAAQQAFSLIQSSLALKLSGVHAKHQQQLHR
ncbi:MAG TPA: ethanolamine ammonia-lyase subunit EutC [Chitinophagaceae bacterium]|nr:ethanolamine ammonia-lyase subunit EutC [Chitinophagaceae bacterium]